MGQIVKASCDCGFEGSATVGGTMASFKERSGFPYQCKDCKDLVTVNIACEDRTCPECGGENILSYHRPPREDATEDEVFDEEFTQANDLARGVWLRLCWSENPCPACGKNALKFRSGIRFC